MSDRKPATRALELVTTQPWCITEGALRTIVSVAARENPSPEQVATELGRPLANTRTVRQRDGVAIIPVTGPIFRRANLFSEISGGTSIEVLAQDFAKALNDRSVKAILLSIDSPGGEANGVGEFAAMVAQARAVKPITAYIGGIGASAAYWIASAASEIVCDASALIGSIGTIMTIAGGDKESTDVQFVSSQSPNKAPDPETEAGKAELQSIVDALTSVFVGAVASNRGLTPEAVIAGGRQGGILVGQQAVTAGLADRLGSEESVIEELIASTPAARLPVVAQPASVAIPSGAVVSASFTPGGASIIPRLQEGIPMSEQDTTTTPVVVAAPAPPPVNDAVVNAQVQAYVSQLQKQYEAAQQSAMERAQLEFERKLAEMQARQQIESYAQHVTTPTLSRQHALPGEAGAYSAFLLSLNGDQRKQATALFDTILASGLVSFEEIGSGNAGDGQSDHEAVLARVESIKASKMSSGMGAVDALSAAIRAVGKDAYNAARAATKEAR